MTVAAADVFRKGETPFVPGDFTGQGGICRLFLYLVTAVFCHYNSSFLSSILKIGS